MLVDEPPHLWFAHDTNGDLKADTKELVCDYYGRAPMIEHNANRLIWALDNWMHTSEGDIYFAVEGRARFEIGKTLSRGQWGASQDDVGHIYRNSNSRLLHVGPGVRRRTSRATRTCFAQRGSYEFLGETNELNRLSRRARTVA